MNNQNVSEKLTFILPLINFETKLRELSISPSIRMRRLTREEKQCMIDNKAIQHWFSFYCLEIEAEDDLLLVKEKVFPAMSALRLLKSNPVGINSFLYSKAEVLWREVFRLRGNMEVDISFNIGAGTYVLEENEKTILVGLYNRITEMLKDKKLRLALERFNMIYSPVSLEKKLLDLMITLETLYLSGKSEKKFRLCCYMTYTLSSGSEKSTKEIWNYVDKAYDLRSNIVHESAALPIKISIGKEKDRIKIPIENFLDKIEEYTRESLVKFIRREKKVKEAQSDIKEDVIKKIGTNTAYVT